MAKKLDPLLEEEKTKLEEVLVKESEDTVEESTSPEEVDQETFDASADIDAIFKDMDISEEFKAKATRVYEASVIALATQVAENVSATIKETLEEEFASSVEEYENALNEQVNDYLKVVTEQWLQENEIPAINVVRTELAESLLGGLRDLLESHYIDLPEEKVDIVAELQESLEVMAQKQNALIEDIVSLKKQNESLIKESIIKESAAGLTDVEKDKFERLSEALDFSNQEEFVEKLYEIRESYFPTSEVVSKQSDFDNEDPVELDEEFVPQQKETNFNLGPVLNHLGKTRRTTSASK